QRVKKIAQLTICVAAVYLLIIPRPRNKPVHSQFFSADRFPRAWVGSALSALQPEIIAATQNKTERASTVSNVEPTASNGVAARIRMSQNAARAFTSRAINRSNRKERAAASTGERKRIPNSLSPHSEVPMNCA